MEENNLTIAKVIIHKDTIKQKIDNFIQENQIMQLSKDITESFQKQIQQKIHKYNRVIDKNQQKHLLQIKSMPPNLNAVIKTHKEDEPIISVINNTQAPSYKLSKYLKKKLNQLIKLPYTYATRNSKEVAQALNRIQINGQHKITTLDIKLIVHLLVTVKIIKDARYRY